MAKKQEITNAMRLLTKANVEYETLYYELDDDTPFSSEAVCRALGVDEASSFKTLCARGERKGIAVFVVPTTGELDLRLAARALDDKKVSMVHVNELLTVAGYERGSVSPIGMKKKYPTFIDWSAESLQKMRISGGMKGVTIMVEPKKLASFLNAKFAPITHDKDAE